MDENTGTVAGAGKAASGTGMLWLGGVGAGLAAGAILWFLALGPMQTPPGPAGDAAAKADATTAAAPAKPVTGAAGAPAATVAEPAAVAAGQAAAPEPVAAPVAEPAAAPPAEASAEPAPAPAPAPAAAAAAISPSFDTVRAEADGSVLVAGRAAPGAAVTVMADGAEVGRATADASGQFVAFLSLEASSAARVLTLGSKGADGAMIASEASVILAPVPPAQVAAASPADAATGPSATSAETAAAQAPPADGATATAAEPAPATETATETPTETTTGTPTETAAVAEPATPAAPQVLIADPKGVRKLAPGVAASILIDTIAYSAAGDVQLSGRAPAGGMARVYLDNAPVGETPVAADGTWSVTLPGIAAGRYTLRVDHVGPDGKVTSRFETPFQREAPEVVAAATQAPGETAETAPVAAGAAAPAAAEAGTASAQAPAVTAAEASAAEAPAATGTAPAAADAATAVTAPATADLPPITTASVVTVQPGFTLWRIARENYGDGMLYVKVFDANRNQIRDPDLIYPGQIFTVPQGG